MKFKTPANRDVYINPPHVAAIEESEQGVSVTKIYLSGGQIIHVMSNIEEVNGKLAGPSPQVQVEMHSIPADALGV